MIKISNFKCCSASVRDQKVDNKIKENLQVQDIGFENGT